MLVLVSLLYNHPPWESCQNLGLLHRTHRTHIFIPSIYHIKGSDAQAHNNIIRTTKSDSYTYFVKDIGSTLMLLCDALKYNLLQ